MLLEVGAQLTPMEMDFFCFSSALKSLVSSLKRQKKKKKKKEKNGFHFFPPFCLPYIPILDTIARLIQYFMKLSGQK